MSHPGEYMTEKFEEVDLNPGESMTKMFLVKLTWESKPYYLWNVDGFLIHQNVISSVCFIYSAGRYQDSGGSWGTATALTTNPTGLMWFTEPLSFVKLANVPNIWWYRTIVPVLCILNRQARKTQLLHSFICFVFFNSCVPNGLLIQMFYLARSLCWKNKPKHCSGWFVVREKYCSGWKNKLKSTDYKRSEHDDVLHYVLSES